MPAEPGVGYTPSRCRVVHIWMTDDEYAMLDRAAAATQKHPDRLAKDLLSHVLTTAEQRGLIE
jgi:hypothetical protein